MNDPASGRSFAAAAGVLSLSMLAASAGNYVLNLFLARRLTPEAFGDATLMVTLMLGLTAVAVGLQLVSAHMVSTASSGEPATAGSGVVEAIRAGLLRRAWMAGWAATALTVLAAPTLSRVFSTASAWPFVILAAGLPFYLAQAVERGVLQGELRISRLAASFIAEAAVRLSGGVLLVVAGLGVEGATLGLSTSFVASWLVVRSPRHVRTRVDVAAHLAGARTLVRSTSVLLVGQLIINNGDVIIAKQAFEPGTAGRYAAVALMGRAVFFCSWAVVNAVFPLSARESRDSVGSTSMRWAVATVACTSGAMLVAIQLGADAVVPVAFGEEYRSVVHLFAPYALATALFALANVVATVDMAHGRTDTPLAVLGASIVQTGVLVAFGVSPAGLIGAQVAVMTGLVCLVAVVHALPTWRVKTGRRPADGHIVPSM